MDNILISAFKTIWDISNGSKDRFLFQCIQNKLNLGDAYLWFNIYKEG